MGDEVSVDWTEERPTIELVKQTITVPEVAGLLGFDVTAGDKIISPFQPDERTPSCHLYDDHWWCYSTGQGGDVIDLVRAFDPDITVPKAVRLLWSRALRAGKEPGDVAAQPPRLLEDFTGQIDGLAGLPADLFGLPTSTYGVVETGDGWLIPHREPERCYGVKVRYRAGGKGSWAGSQFVHRLYDPYGWARPVSAPQVVICEGESDAWALLSRLDDVDVFGLPAGAGSWKDHWLTDLESYRTIWICTDNDRAGRAAADRLQSKIGWARTEMLRVPDLYSDARAAIEAGWTPIAQIAVGR